MAYCHRGGKCSLKKSNGKYGSERGGWYSKEGRGGNGVGLWKFIKTGWKLFSRYINFEFGRGSKVLFWSDSWWGDQALKDVYPGLYGIE